MRTITEYTFNTYFPVFSKSNICIQAQKKPDRHSLIFEHQSPDAPHLKRQTENPDKNPDKTDQQYPL